jgi:hypothetical protein
MISSSRYDEDNLFSLSPIFLRSASVQCENHSHNEEHFPAIPNMPGSIGPKQFGRRPRNNLGSGHATISDAWITICFTIYSYRQNHWLQTTNFSVFIAFFSISVALSQNTTGITTATTWPPPAEWPPSTPHEALCSKLMLRMDGRQKPPSLRMYFWGGLRVCITQS